MPDPGRNVPENDDFTSSASLIHAPCLQLAKTRFPQLSVRFLCQFAQITRPVTARSIVDKLTPKSRQVPQAPLRFSHLAPTKLGFLLKKTAELPLELQNSICDDFKPGFLSSMVVCDQTLNWMEEFSELVKSPACAGIKQISLPVGGLTQFDFLGANMMSVLGDSCLTLIGADPSAAYDLTIPISDQGRRGDALGLQYTLGTYGIRKIRIQYQDGSVSPWLGDTSGSGWTRFAPLTDLRSLAWQSDVCQPTLIINITFADIILIAGLQGRDHILEAAHRVKDQFQQ